MASPEEQIAESGGHRSAPAPPARKLERTRQRLVCAIRDEIQRTGAFTAERAARRADSSTATFYNHFACKDEALLAVYTAVMEDLVRFVRAELSIERLLERGLEQFVADWTLAVAGFFREHSGVFRAAQARLSGSSALRDVYRLHEAQAFEAYRRFVVLGQAARAFRADDANAIAQVLLITSEGWSHPSMIRMQRGDPLHRTLVASVVRMLAAEGSDSLAAPERVEPQEPHESQDRTAPAPVPGETP